MTDTLTTLASENLNPSLRGLLEDVQRGHIRVPRFQRPFVWTDTQRLELLESIRDNMPIGSLLVWRTIKFNLASFENVGPHLIPVIDVKAPTTGWQYLLDGHQRVSTLLGLLIQANPEFIDNSDANIDWNIQYDLKDERFVFVKKRYGIKTERPLLPLWTLFDGRLVNKYLREIRKKIPEQGWTDDEFDTWEVRADQLSYRFQQCRIPIVVMVTDDLELAARSFQRINSLGTPMGEAHLVAALTWDYNFDLREELNSLRRSLPPGWRSIDDSLILQVTKGLSGLDMTKSGQKDLVRGLKDDKNLLEKTAKGLRRAIDWFVNDFGVVRYELLPYAFQVTLLAVELAKNELDQSAKIAAKAWFWRTSWSEAFGSASYRQIVEEQKNLKLLISQNISPEWVRERPLSPKFDFRSARACLFMLRLTLREDLFTPEGVSLNGQELQQEFGRGALLPLFSTPKGANANLKLLLQGVGNRFLLRPGSEASFRDRLENGPNFTRQVLESHFINDSILKLLRSGDLFGFIKERANKMQEWDLAEYEKLAARTTQDDFT